MPKSVVIVVVLKRVSVIEDDRRLRSDVLIKFEGDYIKNCLSAATKHFKLQEYLVS